MINSLKLKLLTAIILPSALNSFQLNAMDGSSGTAKQNLLSLHSKCASIPLKTLRNIDSDAVPTICSFGGQSPRLAKDEDYANAVLKAWREDMSNDDDCREAIGSQLTYQTNDGTDLSGYLVSCSNRSQSSEKVKEGSLPGILLFHTGAGPQDIFLRWKAESLARNKIWGENGCVVFIVDIISDSEGWAWSDRERYNAARSGVLASFEQNGEIKRWKLRDCINSAIDVLIGIEEVDADSIAAMGWCFGGHPILELGLMKEPSVKALISYHGVFDGVRKEEDHGGGSSQLKDHNTGELSNVLICNGIDDPFVEQADIENTEKIFKNLGHEVEILNFDGVKHGFTNPAQDYNPSDAFRFDENAANQAWEKSIQLLKEKLCN